MLMKLISYFKTRRWASIYLFTGIFYGFSFLIDYLMTQTLPTAPSVLRGIIGCFLFSLFVIPKRAEHP